MNTASNVQPWASEAARDLADAVRSDPELRRNGDPSCRAAVDLAELLYEYAAEKIARQQRSTREWLRENKDRYGLTLEQQAELIDTLQHETAAFPVGSPLENKTFMRKSKLQRVYDEDCHVRLATIQMAEDYRRKCEEDPEWLERLLVTFAWNQSLGKKRGVASALVKRLQRTKRV